MMEDFPFYFNTFLCWLLSGAQDLVADFVYIYPLFFFSVLSSQTFAWHVEVRDVWLAILGGVFV